MFTESIQLGFNDRLAIRRSQRANSSDRWAIVLAGGDGTRLRSLTRAIAGDDRPKQFCPILRNETLLDQTRRRVSLAINSDQTLLSLTETHKQFYEPLVANVPVENLVVQPGNLGTAPAILYALLRIAAKSPKAVVGLFPSDHYFADDKEFMSHVDLAFNAAQVQPETVTLLGITPSGPETEYGWIEPQRSILGSLPRSITRVSRFWEKPGAKVARSLMQQGCLWNSFVMVGRVDALLRMTREALPELFLAFARTVPMFGEVLERSAMCDLYRRIPDSNFSHEVLAERPDDLAVMRVGAVGWSDLGEPARVLATLARMGVETEMAMSAS